MKNPLNKRLLKELKSDFGKYLVIFVLIGGMIALVSGFLVADESMINAYEQSFDQYQIEDGHFIIDHELNKAQQARLEKKGVHIYKLYYKQLTFNNKSHIRIYANRKKVNKVCVMEGRLANKKNEIAIDRMYADNHRLKVGDTLSYGKTKYHITGLIACGDYSALFENNSDAMFDAINFSVALVSQSQFNTYTNVTYDYAWRYNKRPKDTDDEYDKANSLMKELNKIVTLDDYVPQYSNQAITFTGEDMGGDRGMMMLLLYILIIIIAFVFGITISNTISKEAGVIGTLMASGYTKKELLKHYMTLPTVVTLFSALVGNVLGYTVMKGYMADLYYGSYSLPTYHTIYSSQAFLETTLLPIILMFIINMTILSRKLSLSPQDFLRRDLRKNKKRKAIYLNHHMPFMSRFRLRIFFQNKFNYLILFIGILFANILVVFGLALPNILNNYQQSMKKQLIAKYQYILKIPSEAMNEEDEIGSLINMTFFRYDTETENKTAEKFMAYTLKTMGEDGSNEEDVMLYGIKAHSRYVNIPASEDTVYISSAYADKYNIGKGDTITLKEPYQANAYHLTVTGVYHYDGSISVFMPQSSLNDMLGLDDDFYLGYFSNTEIKDIQSKYIESTIDFDTMTKISRQLDVSMGSMMGMITIIALIIFMLLVYLLSKVIIEKNATSISMSKILGYDNLEIAKLYILTNALLTILFLAITVPLSYYLLKPAFIVVMRQEMKGWLTFNISTSVFVKSFLLGVGTYIIVAIFEYYKIAKVPYDQALKDIE